MKPEPNELQELHQIRERLSEELKGRTPQQVIEFYRQEAEKATKEFGLHLKRQPRREVRRKAG